MEGDLTIVGGGLSGVCAAIVAARQGLKVVLIQDRPVLGGNASSEVRLWALGATSHQGNNNRFSREGGVIDEIMVENMWRNPEGNPVLFDMVLIDKVRAEEKIHPAAQYDHVRDPEIRQPDHLGGHGLQLPDFDALRHFVSVFLRCFG
ncbi:MAG: FAD-dependent oxidoreductase [Alistipes senegalensis]